jgi:hypothetical protein
VLTNGNGIHYFKASRQSKDRHHAPFWPALSGGSHEQSYFSTNPSYCGVGYWGNTSDCAGVLRELLRVPPNTIHSKYTYNVNKEKKIYYILLLCVFVVENEGVRRTDSTAVIRRRSFVVARSRA